VRVLVGGGVLECVVVPVRESLVDSVSVAVAVGGSARVSVVSVVTDPESDRVRLVVIDAVCDSDTVCDIDDVSDSD
jgi:hypothetical protein